MTDSITTVDQGGASSIDEENRIFDLVLKMNALEDAEGAAPLLGSSNAYGSRAASRAPQRNNNYN
jgi:hypothetical protein